VAQVFSYQSRLDQYQRSGTRALFGVFGAVWFLYGSRFVVSAHAVFVFAFVAEVVVEVSAQLEVLGPFLGAEAALVPAVVERLEHTSD
jgi:hypothetical protein